MLALAQLKKTSSIEQINISICPQLELEHTHSTIKTFLLLLKERLEYLQSVQKHLKQKFNLFLEEKSSQFTFQITVLDMDPLKFLTLIEIQTSNFSLEKMHKLKQ